MWILRDCKPILQKLAKLPLRRMEGTDVMAPPGWRLPWQRPLPVASPSAADARTARMNAATVVSAAREPVEGGAQPNDDPACSSRRSVAPTTHGGDVPRAAHAPADAHRVSSEHRAYSRRAVTAKPCSPVRLAPQSGKHIPLVSPRAHALASKRPRVCEFGVYGLRATW